MSPSTIILNRRLKRRSNQKFLVLLLSANERNRLRGRCKSTCGQELLLQLPREGPLIDGEVLIGKNPLPEVLVKAAIENLIVVRAQSILELTQAAYHLGNRHVDLELHTKELFLLEDPVLTRMLINRRLSVKKIKKPFFPELGAYSQAHSHNNS